MEPNSALTALLAGVSTLLAPGERQFDINTEAPAEHRPLQLAFGSDETSVHPSQLERVALMFDANGQPAIALSFRTAMGAWIAAKTTTNVGQHMDVRLCGDLMSSPIVVEPIRGGNVQISGDFDIEAWTAAMAIITGRVDCDATPLVDLTLPEPPRRKGGSRGE